MFDNSKSFVELGDIMLREFSEDELISAYGTTDPYWVGRYALDYGDIDADGELN